jgi:hypothetical protein
MRNYILNMITQSLHEYVNLFRFPISECPYIEPGTIIYYDSLPHAPRFIVRLYQVGNSDSKDGSIVEFEPPLSEISEAVLEGVHNILDTISSIPMISKVLYGDNADELLKKVALNAAGNNGQKSEPIWDVLVRGASEDDPNLLHIKVEKSLINDAEAELKDYCLKCFEVVEEYVLKYDEYQHMYSAELEKSMDEFFAQEHSFVEYCLEIEKYRELAAEIYRNPKKVELPLVELNLDELHKALGAKAMSLSNRFMDRIIKLTSKQEKKYESLIC